MLLDALLLNAAILLAAVMALWAISVRINDVSFIDSFWGAGMAMLAVVSWLQLGPGAGPLTTLIMAMTAAWGFRLGIYLLRRWRREGEDQRYVRILKKDREAGRFAFAALTKIWLGQAVLLFLVSSPAQVGILASNAGSGPLPPVALAGLALYLLGVFFEWTGDWQLARFKADPANEGKILDTGLWRYTRHPNYFGESCMWWGIFFIMLNHPAGAFAVISPLTMTWLLTKVSGVPMLEKKYTDNPEYAEYISKTSSFFPRRPKP